MFFVQEKVHAKSNKITAIPELLKKIDLQEKIITIDAIGAQRNICEQIVTGNGDCVIALKKNQIYFSCVGPWCSRCNTCLW